MFFVYILLITALSCAIFGNALEWSILLGCAGISYQIANLKDKDK